MVNPTIIFEQFLSSFSRLLKYVAKKPNILSYVQNMKLLGLFLVVVVGATSAQPFKFETHTIINYESCASQISTGYASFCRLQRYSAVYKCICTNLNAMATFAGCLQVDGRNDLATIDYFVHLCSAYGFDYTEAIFNNALQYFESKAVPLASFKQYMSNGLVTRPVRYSEEFSNFYNIAYNKFLANNNNLVYYSLGLIGYWLVVLFLFALNNWLKMIPLFVRSKAWLPKLNKHVLVPATIGSKKQEAAGFGFFSMLVPSRLETIILLGFLALCLAFLSSNMDYLPGDPVFASKSIAIEKYLAVRCGIITTVTLPLLILFGGRNNFLQWITGINFATFITFHRWIARMLITMITIHAICYSLSAGAYYKSLFLQGFVVCGAVGVVSGGLIFLQSLLYIRRKWYELFLVVHILLALIFVIGGWKHVTSMGYVWFFYLSLAIWAFDRTVRLCRIVSFGFPSAKLELINGDLIKLQISTQKWKQSNASFAYVRFLLGMKSFQSHPYSCYQLPGQVNFYIKVKKGITQQLQKELFNFPSASAHMRVAVEGPYGGGLNSNVKYYERAVYIAGGNGIPGMYSEALILARSEQQSKLIWIIRDYNFLNWFHSELMLAVGMNIEIEVYVTRPDTQLHGYVSELVDRSDDESALKEKQLESLYHLTEKQLDDQLAMIKRIQNKFQHISFTHGRPSLQQVVINEAHESVAIVTCGHALMVDEIRQQVANNSGKCKRLDFYEHLQVWA